ncbi:flagellar export protein FliJ [Salisediminibacterium halotolerans]|uniref:flagellar export protein FliJ n=1 Tax=Salisediminibacterium halotolerans TaxID=517425 RepID=UPI000EAC4560|nr:flagellar export protein FliJ [Salisediminibacterium halotolerans]RLJ74219.1 flagellar FliJ protein [Actinophytocola xinjiangensis]RPE87688.1 flagellar FliJ protein [Salisediminibacterium halotolerans]TWG35056.1 flagellar FliJ protein [Salisediminibacterium halotolerans]GEL06657.1 hypothetical protein SHA02_00730 [Salisediminibacterium halotolerans]
MSFQFSLQKVLDVRDREKNEAEKSYHEAVEAFEQTATKLYEMLKRREELEHEKTRQLTEGLSIAGIQMTEQTLAYLQKEIARLEKETNQKRSKMQEKQKYLTVKTVDLKKYEKMKELKHEAFLAAEKSEEMKFLDEISVQQFVRR